MEKESSKTKMIGQPLARYRNPNDKPALLTSPLSEITFVLPNGNIQDFDLKQNIIIGRGKFEDDVYRVNLDDVSTKESGVSREHAIVQLIDKQLYVCDFDSMNGTFLNGDELFSMRNYPLQDGDVLRIGKIKIEVRLWKKS